MIDLKDIKKIMALKTPVYFKGIECFIVEYRLKFATVYGLPQFVQCVFLQEVKNDKVFYEAKIIDVSESGE